MKYQEKKYQLASFDQIKEVLNQLGIKKTKPAVSKHYYGKHKGNDVTKLVEYEDKKEIHILKEKSGRFDLVETIPMKSVKAGLRWLKDRGYQVVDIVKLVNEDYEYKGGLVRLYTIDDWLLSVVLDYPEGQHEAIARDFGLDETDRIKMPYNKQLEQAGKLRSMSL